MKTPEQKDNFVADLTSFLIVGIVIMIVMFVVGAYL